MTYYNATGKEREEEFLSSFAAQLRRAQGGESKKPDPGKLGESMGTLSPGAEGGRKAFKPSKPSKPSNSSESSKPKSKPKKKPAGGMSRNERNLRRRQGRL